MITIFIAALVLLLPLTAFSAQDPSCEPVSMRKAHFAPEVMTIDHLTKRVFEPIHIESDKNELAEETLKCVVSIMTPPRGISVLDETSIRKWSAKWVNGKEKFVIRVRFWRPLP